MDVAHWLPQLMEEDSPRACLHSHLSKLAAQLMARWPMCGCAGACTWAWMSTFDAMLRAWCTVPTSAMQGAGHGAGAGAGHGVSGAGHGVAGAGHGVAGVGH